MTELPQEAIGIIGETAGQFTDTQLGAALLVSVMINCVFVFYGFKYLLNQIKFWRKKAEENN